MIITVGIVAIILEGGELQTDAGGRDHPHGPGLEIAVAPTKEELGNDLQVLIAWSTHWLGQVLRVLYESAVECVGAQVRHPAAVRVQAVTRAVNQRKNVTRSEHAEQGPRLKKSSAIYRFPVGISDTPATKILN